MPRTLLTNEQVADGTIADAKLATPPSTGDAKNSVVTVAETNIDLTSVPATINGITMAEGDRFACASQTDPTENGIYVYPSSSGSAASRASDADSTADLTIGASFVAEDTGDRWTVVDAGTLDTDDVEIERKPADQPWYTVEGTTDGGTTIDLTHDDVASTTIEFHLQGVLLRQGASHDYTFGDGAGSAGVDQVETTFTPDSGQNYIIKYQRQ